MSGSKWRDLVGLTPTVPAEPLVDATAVAEAKQHNRDLKVALVTCLECPFAQRTWVTLLEKGIRPSLSFVSLRGPDGKYTNDFKPQWFWQYNPNGKVPVVVDRGKIVYESSICNEYIDEAYPNLPLSPSDPFSRFQMRLWIDFFNTKIMPLFYQILLQQDPEKREPIQTEFLKHLKTLNDALEKLSSQGPYAFGTQFTLLDIALLPFVERFELILPNYRNFGIPKTDEFKRLNDWFAAARQRPSFRATKIVLGEVVERQQLEDAQEQERLDKEWDEYMLWVYRAYADNTATSTSATDYRAALAKRN